LIAPVLDHQPVTPYRLSPVMLLRPGKAPVIREGHKWRGPQDLGKMFRLARLWVLYVGMAGTGG